MEVNLDRITKVSRFPRVGVPCFHCPARQHLIKETPEERVRQAVILTLTEDLNYPIELIESEVHLSHIKKGLRDRADIVVFKEPKSSQSKREVLILIECKEPHEPIDVPKFLDDLERYNKVLQASVKILTNGISSLIWLKNTKSESYRKIKELPKFRDLLKRQNIKYKNIEKPFIEMPILPLRKDGKFDIYILGYYRYLSRVPYNQIVNKDWMQNELVDLVKYGIIGKKSSFELVQCTFKLFDIFFDPFLFYDPNNLYGIEIVEDKGYRFDKFGYPTGQLYGVYRYFIIKWRNSTQIISFSIYSMYQRTYLLVGVDDYEKRNHTLEMNLDKHISFNEITEDFTITHNGRLTKGKSSIAPAKVLNFINEYAPELIRNNVVFLGKFNLKDNMRKKKKATADFIARVMLYGLVRNVLRKEI